MTTRITTFPGAFMFGIDVRIIVAIVALLGTVLGSLVKTLIDKIANQKETRLRIRDENTGYWRREADTLKQRLDQLEQKLSAMEKKLDTTNRENAYLTNVLNGVLSIIHTKGSPELQEAIDKYVKEYGTVVNEISANSRKAG